MMNAQEEQAFLNIYNHNMEMMKRIKSLKVQLRDERRRFKKLRCWTRERIRLCDMLVDVWKK